MSSGYYKQSDGAKETLFAIFQLTHDVEITVFRDDGRDITFKGRGGDDLILQQDEDGRWFPYDVTWDGGIEDDFVPVGDA